MAEKQNWRTNFVRMLKREGWLDEYSTVEKATPAYVAESLEMVSDPNDPERRLGLIDWDHDGAMEQVDLLTNTGRGRLAGEILNTERVVANANQTLAKLEKLLALEARRTRKQAAVMRV